MNELGLNWENSGGGVSADVESRSPLTQELHQNLLAARWVQAANLQRRVASVLERATRGLDECAADRSLVEAGEEATVEARHLAHRCLTRASLHAVGRLDCAVDVETVDSQELLTEVIEVVCVGQTLAALESFEAAANASDDDVASLLEDRAESEARRAQFGWRVLRWVFSRATITLRASLIFQLETSMGNMLEVSQFGSAKDRFDFSRDGFLAGLRRRDVTVRGLAAVVEPCARAIPRFSEQPASRSARWA